MNKNQKIQTKTGVKIATGKRMQFNLVVLTSLAMLVPVSRLVSNSGHWNPSATPALVSSPAGLSIPGTSIDGIKVQPKNAKTVSNERQKIREEAAGNVVKETFDHKGRRISKILSTPAGVLLNRWYFEPVQGRILRYEARDYSRDRVTRRRVARWEYANEGGFVKTSQFYDSKNKPGNSFVEWVNKENIKTKEVWYDAAKRQIDEKLWEPATGRFVSHLMTQYSPGGWVTQSYRDENGELLRQILLTPGGKVISAIQMRSEEKKQ